MGIHDRDYIRQRPPGRGPLSMGARGLSVVAWLIIINVAVFFIDGALWNAGKGIPINGATAYYDGEDPHQPQQTLKQGTQLGSRIDFPIVNNAGEQIGVQSVYVMPPIEAIGHFSTTKAFTHIEVWRFITFQFLHADLTHIFFNMIGLYFFGPIVERRLGRKLFLAFYLTCGICGAFLYLLLNLLGFLVNEPDTPLIGASAGVFGVLMAAGFLARDAIMLVFFVLPMRVSTGAYLFVAIAALNLILRGSNAGGDAAHLGGAAAGFFFIRKPELLLDFFDDFLDPGKKGRKAGRPRRLKGRRQAKPKSDAKLDAILDKVNREGMHALTDAERKFLADASKERRDA